MATRTTRPVAISQLKALGYKLPIEAAGAGDSLGKGNSVQFLCQRINCQEGRRAVEDVNQCGMHKMGRGGVSGWCNRGFLGVWGGFALGD